MLLLTSPFLVSSQKNAFVSHLVVSYSQPRNFLYDPYVGHSLYTDFRCTILVDLVSVPSLERYFLCQIHYFFENLTHYFSRRCSLDIDRLASCKYRRRSLLAMKMQLSPIGSNACIGQKTLAQIECIPETATFLYISIKFPCSLGLNTLLMEYSE